MGGRDGQSVAEKPLLQAQGHIFDFTIHRRRPLLAGYLVAVRVEAIILVKVDPGDLHRILHRDAPTKSRTGVAAIVIPCWAATKVRN